MVKLCTQCCGYTDKAGFITLGGREDFVLFCLNKFIYFNWRLVNLQYCSGFEIH